jgi:hypothetical protein
MANNTYLQGYELDGTTIVDLIGVNATDWIEIGDPANSVQYDGLLHKFSADMEINAADLTIKGTGAQGDRILTIEADSDNTVEASNAILALAQDGQAVWATYETRESSNYVALMSGTTFAGRQPIIQWIYNSQAVEMPGSLSVTGGATTSELHVLHATSGDSHFNWLAGGDNYITHKTGGFTRIRSFNGVSTYTTVADWDDTGLTFHDSGGTTQGTISQTSSDMKFDSGQHIFLNPGTGHFSYTYRSGSAGDFRAYGNAGTNYIRIRHDDANGLVDAAGGNLLLARSSITKMTVGSSTIDVVSGVDFRWSNASQPWLILDSISAGDNWTAQGAGISVGESGKKGSGAIHLTYNGDGSGYLGMGIVDDTAGTGGRPTWGHIDFTYNNNQVKIGGRLYPGAQGTGATVQSTAYIEDCSNQDYGSIRVSGVTGTLGSWAGYSINDDHVFMSNGTNAGIWNDTNNEWFMRCTDNATVALYYNGGDEARTQDSDATGKTSGWEVRKHDQLWIDVGYNLLPVQKEDVSFTVSAGETGGCFLKDGSTARTVTLEASTSFDFPIHGVMTILNANSSGNITVTEGTGTTLYVLTGSARTDAAGSATIAPGGYATLWRESATLYYLFGAGITP